MANKSSSKQDKHSNAQGKDFKDQILKQPFILKTTDWVAQNLKIVGIIAGLVILALIIGNAWMTYTQGQEQKAAALEGKAIQLHQDAAKSAASEENSSEETNKLYQETIASYQKILDDFSGSASAERALFLLGSLEYDRENYSQAREYFSQYLKKYAQGALALRAKEGLSYIFEQEGDYQKALESLKELEKSVSDAKKADIQMAIARNYRSLGQKDEAMKIYQAIVDSSTSVAVKNQASESLEILQSSQEFPPPSKTEESSPEALAVEEAQPEAEASPIEEAQPEAEASPVEAAQPEAETSPVQEESTSTETVNEGTN